MQMLYKLIRSFSPLPVSHYQKLERDIFHSAQTSQIYVHCTECSYHVARTDNQWRRAILSLGAVAPPKTKIRGPGPPQNRRSGAGS